MVRKIDPSRKLVDAAMELAALRPWSEVSYRDIVATAGLKLGEAYDVAPNKAAILVALSHLADQAVLSEPAAVGDGSVRDRLFDVLMRRFDALKPYRAGLASVAAGALRDPATLLSGACAVTRAMHAMLTAAGLEVDGLRGLIRTKGLTGIWMATLRDFLRDETQDLSPTMAALDKRLARAESIANRFSHRHPAAPPPEPPPVEPTPAEGL